LIFLYSILRNGFMNRIPNRQNPSIATKCANMLPSFNHSVLYQLYSLSINIICQSLFKISWTLHKEYLNISNIPVNIVHFKWFLIKTILENLTKQTGVEPGHAVSEYARNVVALGEMEHQTAELFEPAGRVFGCREMSLEPQLQGMLSEWDAPVQLPPCSLLPGYRHS